MNSIRRTHSAAIRLGFGAFVLLLLLPPISNAQEKLKWEVVNPFRFIHEQKYIEELKSAYSSLGPKKTAEALEIRLQQNDEARVQDLRDSGFKKCMAEGKKTREQCYDETRYPFLGWFAKVASADHAATCWDSRQVQFRETGECRDYLHPDKHRVRVWLESAGSLDEAGLVWNADGKALDSCHRGITGLCKEFDADYIFKKPGGTIVSLSTADGRLLAQSDPIIVKDKLVVGLGDSYASGEGNPDIPAQFMNKQSDVDFAYFWKWRRFPRKDQPGPASNAVPVAWLDQRCHRSMYSYQFKTALQLALSSKPDEAVTFISYSCSGSVTDNIINKNQSAKENMRTGVSNILLPQLQVLRDALKGREIDYLLLSTGGNDLFFAQYVTNIVTSGRTRRMLRLFGIAREPSKRETEEGINQLRTNYKNLQEALLTQSTGVAIKGCKLGEVCRRIILTAYPDYFLNEDEQPCMMDRDEFTLPFNEDGSRDERAARIKRLFANELFAFQTRTNIEAVTTNSTGELPAEKTRWTLAASHRDRYLNHGLCAQAKPVYTPGETKPAPLSIDENFMMLRRRNKEWYAYDWVRKEMIRGKFYDPRDYKAYARRERWIRLPVDSKMTADEQKRFLNWFSYDLFFLDDRSSIIHPTAAALAVHADANIEQIRQIQP